MKRVIITGATGFLGKKIAKELIERGDEVTIFTRSIENAKKEIPDAAQYIYWDLHSDNWKSSLEGKDAVIHLAGENVLAKRWNEKQKEKILTSRVDGVSAFVGAIKNLNSIPEAFISASAVGYYGNSEKVVDETSEAGNDFLAGVVKEWEAETFKVDQFNVRRVNVRIGIILDKQEGALAKLLMPFQFFMGGSLGNGRQWFPWIHIDDVVEIFLFALDNKNIGGILNAVSPNPIRMNEFCRILGRELRRPSFFKVPAFILRIAFGEAADVLLNGAQVTPKRTLDTGYKFKYPSLSEALINILRS